MIRNFSKQTPQHFQTLTGHLLEIMFPFSLKISTVESHCFGKLAVSKNITSDNSGPTNKFHLEYKMIIFENLFLECVDIFNVHCFRNIHATHYHSLLYFFYVTQLMLSFYFFFFTKKHLLFNTVFADGGTLLRKVFFFRLP